MPNLFFKVFILLLAPFSMLAQQPDTVKLAQAAMRIPITVSELDSFSFVVTGLIPSHSFSISAIHDPSNCQNGPRVTVDGLLLGSSGIFESTSSSAIITVFNPCAIKQIWISLFDRYASQSKNESPTEKVAQLLVGTSVSPNQMVLDHLVGGDCYEVTNIVFTGNSKNRGIFSNGDATIGITEGIVLGTGDLPIVAPGPNTSASATFGSNENIVSDADLNQIYDSTYDISKLEFDFVPTDTIISFRFVFASEEYCEYTESVYKDVFGFFISGPGIGGTENMAKIPGTSTPISISTINHIDNSAFYISNIPDSSSQLLQSPCFGHPPANPLTINWIQFDGFTTILTASAKVVPCETYHLKMAIADVGDPIYDSAVFFQESSFNAGGSVTTRIETLSGGNVLYENCGYSNIIFTRELGDPNLTLAIPIVPSGTATMGIDYEVLPDTVYLLGGQNTLVVPIIVFSDGLEEGIETFSFEVQNACNCYEKTFSLTISDQPEINGNLQDDKICFGDSLLVFPMFTGGVIPFTYNWSDGTTNSYFYTAQEGAYGVTVTDVCGSTLSLAAVLTVTDSFGITFSQTQIGLSDTFELQALTNLPLEKTASAFWSPANHLSCFDCPNTQAWPPLTTKYTYTLVSTEGCVDSVSALIKADGVLATFVPNIFTPNFDNINDLLWIFARKEDVTEVLKFEVFDRWGNKLFTRNRGSINEVSSGWDGQFRGVELAPGVYVWTAEIRAYNGDLLFLNGDVTLVR